MLQDNCGPAAARAASMEPQIVVVTETSRSVRAVTDDD